MARTVAHHPVDGDLTIYSVAQRCRQWLDWLESADSLELDLSQVAEIDSAGMQLLIALKREAELHGKSLLLSRHSPVVVEMMDLFDLGAFFGDQMVITSANA